MAGIPAGLHLAAAFLVRLGVLAFLGGACALQDSPQRMAARFVIKLTFRWALATAEGVPMGRHTWPHPAWCMLTPSDLPPPPPDGPGLHKLCSVRPRHTCHALLGAGLRWPCVFLVLEGWGLVPSLMDTRQPGNFTKQYTDCSMVKQCAVRCQLVTTVG